MIGPCHTGWPAPSFSFNLQVRRRLDLSVQGAYSPPTHTLPCPDSAEDILCRSMIYLEVVA